MSRRLGTTIVATHLLAFFLGVAATWTIRTASTDPPPKMDENQDVSSIRWATVRTGEDLQPLIDVLRSGRFGQIHLAEEIGFSYRRTPKGASIEFDGDVRADIPGPANPRVRSIQVMEDHFRAKLGAGYVRVE